MAQHLVTRTSVLQLVDAQDIATYATLRRTLPGIQLVQVIHVTDHASVQEAITIAPHVDAILLDSGVPTPTGWFDCRPSVLLHLIVYCVGFVFETNRW
jgi:phosphoribosylanthranilate isomerase